MNSTNISLLVRAAHLTMGIPALAKATGARKLRPTLSVTDNIDLNKSSIDDSTEGQIVITRTNGWPTRSDWEEPRWLHSDLKDIAYFYLYKFFENVILKGNLK